VASRALTAATGETVSDSGKPLPEARHPTISAVTRCSESTKTVSIFSAALPRRVFSGPGARSRDQRSGRRESRTSIANLPLRSTSVAMCDFTHLTHLPIIKSPSQKPETARSSASAGRSLSPGRSVSSLVLIRSGDHLFSRPSFTLAASILSAVPGAGRNTLGRRAPGIRRRRHCARLHARLGYDVGRVTSRIV
jgi:hypothetical protein